ncbi:MAG: DUF5011 domain-containing protein [Firmicutes bacterium]|nr:DUF5011 domain-containing protein [Bacillota bacterium]
MKNKKKTILILLLAVIAILAVTVLKTPLFIDMEGDKEITVGQNEDFEDPGAKVRFGLGSIRTEGSVDTSQIGDQYICYHFLTEKKTRTVHVLDVTRPVIVLEGSADKYLIAGEEYIEPGYSAYDENDGDLTDKVLVESDLDTSRAGEYHLSYTVTDNAGNGTRERRKVTVVEEGPLSADRLSFDLYPFYDELICKATEYDAEKYGKLLYFGDSFIGNLGDYGVVSYSQLWSRGSLGTDSVYDAPITVYGYYDDSTTFFGAMDIYHPESVLILLNSDRTLHWTPEYLRSSCDYFYGDIKERYPETEFIICSITPVDSYYSSEEWMWREGFDRNDKINKMNAYMCELCRKYGFKFMNAAECLKDPETGCCYDAYIGEDGIHLNYSGYSRMVEYIKNHLDYDR